MNSAHSLNISHLNLLGAGIDVAGGFGCFLSSLLLSPLVQGELVSHACGIPVLVDFV
jgi:hypothetical protein